MRYIERQPAAALAPWILSYWSFQSDIAPPADDPYTVWPDGCLTIGVLRVPGAPALIVCVGPRFTAVQPPVSAMGRLWGLRLWPDAIGSVLGIEARALRGHVGPAPSDLGRRFAPLAAALPVSDDPDVVFPALESWLLRELPIKSLPTPDPCVRAAVRAIVTARGEIAMATVAREAGIGLRQLQRRFPSSRASRCVSTRACAACARRSEFGCRAPLYPAAGHASQRKRGSSTTRT